MTNPSTTTLRLSPYLFFDGKCEEAIEFYKKAVGLEVLMLMRYKDSPEPCAEGTGEKIMHAGLKIGDSRFSASDGHCHNAPKFEGFGMTLNTTSDEEAAKLFAALSEGGNVAMPITKTFFASSFGMVADKFGVLWMIIKEAMQ